MDYEKPKFQDPLILDCDQLWYPRNQTMTEEQLATLFDRLREVAKDCNIKFVVHNGKTLVGDYETTSGEEVLLVGDICQIPPSGKQLGLFGGSRKQTKSSLVTALMNSFAFCSPEVCDVDAPFIPEESWKQTKLRRGVGHHKFKSKKSRGKK